jgi:arginine exporter protein ArgO
VVAARGRVLLRFVGLTAVDPLTALYLVVLAAALGSSVPPSTAVVFTAGVFLASWGWQLGLAAVGAAAGARLPPSARTVTTVVGNLVVLGHAAHLALR